MARRLGLWLALLWAASLTAQDVWLEAESAFATEFGVVGSFRPRHIMVASAGHTIANGWGLGAADEIRLFFETERAIPLAAVSVRCSTIAQPVDLVVWIDGTERGRVTLAPAGMYERFEWLDLELGALPAGEHEIRFTLGHQQEVWVDAVSIHEAAKPPTLVTQREHFEGADNGARFRVFLSPRVSAASAALVPRLLEDLERVHGVLREIFGAAPTRPMTCCVAARADSARGSARRVGLRFVIHESDHRERDLTEIIRQMVYCFQQTDEDHLVMPAWLREGEAHFADLAVRGRLGLDVRPPAGEPQQTRRELIESALGARGVNALLYYGTPLQVEGVRSYESIWRRLFGELYQIDPNLLTALHNRHRASVAAGTFANSVLHRDVDLLNAEYVALLAGDDRRVRTLLGEWGVTDALSRDALPALGPRLLGVECGARGPGGEHPWRPEFDAARRAPGVQYRVEALAVAGDAAAPRCWVCPESGPLTVDLQVPGGFLGELVLEFAVRTSHHTVEVDGRSTRLALTRSCVAPIRAGDDGSVRVRISGDAGAPRAKLTRMSVHEAAELGAAVVAVECGNQTPDEGANFAWAREHDTARIVAGFDYSVVGQAWRHGEQHQWFGHDHRFGERPLEVRIEVPVGFVGVLLLAPDDEGRVQHVIVEGQRLCMRMGNDLRIPIGKEETADGMIRVELRKVEGMNCALRRLILARNAK